MLGTTLGLALAAALAIGAAAASKPIVTTVQEPAQCTDEDRVMGEGDRVRLHYTGTIHSSSKTGVPGKEFDSTHGRGLTLNVTLGRDGQLVAGVEQGLIGLCQGARATILVPPELAYGYGPRGVAHHIHKRPGLKQPDPPHSYFVTPPQSTDLT